MASSSKSAKVTPPWLELPREITAMILQKLGIIEIFKTAEKVCPIWRSVCQDAAMWRRIDMGGNDPWMLTPVAEKLCRVAVDRSQGQLIDISIKHFGSDDLLLYMSQRSSKLKRLRLACCATLTDNGLSEALKNFPLLEELHLYYNLCIGLATIKSVGLHCPHLKSFKFNKRSYRFVELPDQEALGIAENMPELRHLQLIGNAVKNEGVQAVLDGCPHLESLDLRQCFNVDLGGAFGRLCRQQIKDLRQPNDATDDYEFEIKHRPLIDYDSDFDDRYGSYDIEPDSDYDSDRGWL